MVAPFSWWVFAVGYPKPTERGEGSTILRLSKSPAVGAADVRKPLGAAARYV